MANDGVAAQDNAQATPRRHQDHLARYANACSVHPLKAVTTVKFTRACISICIFSNPWQVLWLLDLCEILKYHVERLVCPTWKICRALHWGMRATLHRTQLALPHALHARTRLRAK